MDYDKEPEFGPPAPFGVAARGASPFAQVNRTGMGKVALGLSLAPWVAYGLMCVLQPG
jgi:hypothetical protein